MPKTIKITNGTGDSITIKMNTEGILSDMGPPIGKQGHINVNVSDASYCEFWVYSCTSGGQSRQLVLSSNDLLKHKEVVIRTSAATGRQPNFTWEPVPSSAEGIMKLFRQSVGKGNLQTEWILVTCRSVFQNGSWCSLSILIAHVSRCKIIR